MHRRIRFIISFIMVVVMILCIQFGLSNQYLTIKNYKKHSHLHIKSISFSLSTATTTTTTTTTTMITNTVTPSQWIMWSRVAQCEEGGNWHVIGPLYTGGLGISRTNWIAYGGLEYAPIAAQATPDEQIMVAERIQNFVPDQVECAPW